MKPKIPIALLGILMALCTVVQVRAANISYDAVADFSTSQNTDTSTWSYRYQTVLDRNGLYPLLPTFAPAYGFSPVSPGVWQLESPIPLVGVNQTGMDVTYIDGDPEFPYPFTWPNGAMLVHPGPFDPGLVAVSWLSPIDALVTIKFSFGDLDNHFGDGVNWFVERNNGNDTLIAGSFGEGGSSGLQVLAGVAVNVGDRINFIVDPADDYNFDSTSFTATITPEPSTAALLGLSLPGGFWIWRKVKRGQEGKKGSELFI